MYFLLTQTMYNPVFVLQETSYKPLYTFTLIIHYWPRVKMGIPSVDRRLSHSTHLPSLLWSYSFTLHPTPDSGFNYLYPAPTAKTTALLNLSTLPSWPTHIPYFSIWHHLPTLLIILLKFSSSSSLLLPEAYNEDQ